MKLIESLLDFGDAAQVRVDGISGVYRLSEHTMCVEMYANKIVDGKVQKAVLMRNTWDDRLGLRRRLPTPWGEDWGVEVRRPE
jgi:hypothetical protein